MSHIPPSNLNALILGHAEITPESRLHVWSDAEKTQDCAQALHALTTQDFHVSLDENPHGPGYQVHCYHPKHALALSDVWDVLQSIGFTIQTHESYVWTFPHHGKVWVNRFAGMWCNRSQTLSVQQKQHVGSGLKHVRAGNLRRGSLNRLLTEEGFSWRQVELFHVMVDYVRQLRPAYDTALIETTILAHPPLAALWMKTFDARLNPDKTGAIASERFQDIQETIHTLPQHEHDLWSMLFETLHRVVRTNFYQKNVQGLWKPYIAFKLDHHRETRPKQGLRYEIFVSSSWMQGVHFRAGSVARGGIRWSDRLGDFRREVWDLAQTQVLKNAIIVPTGAKGGFIVTHTPEHQTRSAFLEQGKKAYDTLIHGLLDVTDNQVGDCIVPPEDTVCHDDPDPYLVVAADKGTASFSDRANSIALERGFWLGDAFASGGSVGYDHKKLGITSSGAWESLKRHAHHLGWSADRPLTVIGIGDMSGDVFGNGMLKSPFLKLIAAFDHRHIFLDPNPDLKCSFQERQRLFERPGSQWSDYDLSLISEGGGVFERVMHDIELSHPVRERFHIHQISLSPSELIRALLKAPVDLIWFGGIGTFVKGRQEDDITIGDQANQWLRVNGDEVQAKIIVEGANLGMTQAGRIQFAHAGGRVNTDTIDNSAGVHCSDYEVNLKILLNQAVRDKVITETERVDLLQSMTKQVVEKILTQNAQVNQILSCAERESQEEIHDYLQLRQTLKVMRKRGYPVTHLPSERAMAERGLARPELCLIVAYCKLWLKHCLLTEKSWLSEDAVLYALQQYFPRVLREHPHIRCETHPLKDQIVATVWTNEAINRYGPCFVIQKDTKLSSVLLAQRMGAFISHMLDASTQELWQHIDRTSLHISFDATYQSYQTFKRRINFVS